jgi:hypothetical protein
MERFPFETDVAPTVEVRVFRDGRLVHRELCESDADAADVVARWEGAGVTAEVDALSGVAPPIDDPDRLDELAEPLDADDEYPHE